MIRAPYKSAYSTSGHFILALGLPASLFQFFPQVVPWNGKTFQKKSEFHITLIHAGPDDEIRLAPFFTHFIEEHPINVLSFQKDFRHAVRGDEETIIVRCTVSNLELLFQKMRDEIDLNLPLQPAHITLYTFQSRTGIGISNEEEMENLPRVSISVLDEALQHVHI